jgi:ATP-dependent Lhr-like helicase
MPTLAMDAAAYRDALPRVYGALLAHHGRPTEIQLAAASPLLAGRDAMLCAPTAAGKTVAYMAPLVERLAKGGEGPARILVVSPTRALVNDLHRRLAPRLATCGIEVGRWTGDHHDGGRLHEVSILTPEGLDSRLSRAPAALVQVGALVLDELHVLDGSARGDQLRVLVQRLRTERGPEAPPLQVVAASATVPELEEVAGRYLRDPEIVVVGARRSVRARVTETDGPESVRQVLLTHVRQGFRKVLLFCNRRDEVESISRHMAGRPPFGHAVFAHHGSLARAVRLDAERRFSKAPTGLCVCTSTLELGVDIGDVDLVVLLGVPPDVASLLQRVGRGGRRRSENHAVGLVAGAFEAASLRTLLDAQRQGLWMAAPRPFRAGVLVQQAVSVIQGRKSRTVDAAAMHRRMPPDLAAEWSAERLAPVLHSAAAAGFLHRVGEGPGGNIYGLGAKAEAAWARGQLHGNLAERQTVRVVDGLTGSVVGELSDTKTGVGLAGRGRDAVFTDTDRVVTRSGPGGGLPTFGGGSPFIAGQALCTALLEGAGVPTRAIVGLPGGTAIFHGLGSAGGALFGGIVREEGLLRGSGSRVAHVGRMALVIMGTWPDARWPSPSRVRHVMGIRHRGLGRKLALGAHHGDLPEVEQRAVVAALCEVEAVEAFVARAPPPTLEAPEDLLTLWNEAAWA